MAVRSPIIGHIVMTLRMSIVSRKLSMSTKGEDREMKIGNEDGE